MWKWQEVRISVADDICETRLNIAFPVPAQAKLTLFCHTSINIMVNGNP